jgi:transcriptional regulator with XRE-family HTH domain
MNNTRKKIVKEIGARLKEAREALNCSREAMASHFKINRPSYTKHEQGETFLRPQTLVVLGNTLGVSLDWLICNKGSVLYNEKGQSSGEKRVEDGKLADDVRELLDGMERIPLLRYEVLSFFHRFKMEHKELMEPPSV